VLAAASFWPPVASAEIEPPAAKLAFAENVAAGAAHAVPVHEADPPPPAFYAVIPFVGLLLAIAILPLVPMTQHWWEHNRNRLIVAVTLGAVTLCYYALVYGHGVVDHTTHVLSAPGWRAAATVFKNAVLAEYVPFMVLLFSLYVISGGIRVEGNLVGRPSTNAKIFAVGAVLASFIGTTGAAMLLIRPLLRANARRAHVAHTVVFFIIIVCNTGGCLLPIGDPPLYLGYLRGVDFAWTLSLWPEWAFMNVSLLAVYLVWDHFYYRREDRDEIEKLPETVEDYALRGAVNLLWLAGVIGCVMWLDPSKPFPGTDWHPPRYFREAVMLAFAGLSLATTKTELRRKNSFNYAAIIEVAALFIGIFICMQAPVQILNTFGPQLGIDTAWKFYWTTGALSSFLDNAPTYVVFFETARTIVADGPRIAGVLTTHLAAVSLGSVFMGSMTYIGNGPNFMVKAIAEAHRVRMPSFFGYMIYTCAIVLPLSLLMTWLFL
jgi:Na+/H+ antiporter NhaD/arsenite permease-like protein